MLVLIFMIFLFHDTTLRFFQYFLNPTVKEETFRKSMFFPEFPALKWILILPNIRRHFVRIVTDENHCIE